MSANPAYRDDKIASLRVPPQSEDAEQNVLGSLMLVPEALVQVADWLAPDDFFRRDHRLIYEAILGLAAKKQPFDVVTLGDWFAAGDSARDIGGTAYLIELATTQASAANIIAHAEIVVGKARLRNAITIGTELVNDAFQPNGRDVIEITQRAQQSLLRMAPSPRVGPKSAKTVLASLYEDLQRRYEAKTMPGLPTPWLELNKATHGFQDGEACLIAARTNVGKSLMGFQVAAFNALRKNRTLIFSLEMTAEAVMRRTVAALVGIPHEWLIEPNDKTEIDYWPMVTDAYRQLGVAPLEIDDTPLLSAAQISARAHRSHLQAPLRMVLVDHLHDMALPGKQGEVIERAMALRELKALSKSLGCPVIVLAQLNREAAGDEENPKRPILKNLRGSGGIEEVADVVLLLHADNNVPDGVEIIVAKGRDIKTGHSFFLKSRKDIMRFEDWDGRQPSKCVEAQRTRGIPSNRTSGRDRAAGAA